MSSILVDVDDVVFNLRTLLCKSLSEKTGRSVHYTEWKTYTLEPYYDLSLDDFVSILIEERIIERCLPEVGAREALRRLKAGGHEIVLVTARGWHPDGYGTTAKAFSDHDLPFDRLIVTKLGQPKSSAYAELGRMFTALIDDSSKNLFDVQKSGLVHCPTLIRRPWNVTEKSFVAFDSLYEASTYFDDVTKVFDCEPM